MVSSLGRDALSVSCRGADIDKMEKVLKVLLILSLTALNGIVVAGAGKCAGVYCGTHATCDVDTGRCVCHAGFIGEFCDKLDCGPHGMARRGSEKCWCRMGWTGDRCETCAEPGPGHRFVCVATSRSTGHPYTLAYVSQNQYDEIMRGRIHLDPAARHKAIAPNSRGLDNRMYDCECRPVMPSTRNLLRRQQERDLTDTQAAAYELIVDQCISDAMYDAETKLLFNKFTDECLSSRGIDWWFVVAILLIVLSVALAVLLIYYCARAVRAEREYEALRINKVHSDRIPVDAWMPLGLTTLFLNGGDSHLE